MVQTHRFKFSRLTLVGLPHLLNVYYGLGGARGLQPVLGTKMTRIFITTLRKIHTFSPALTPELVEYQ